MRGNGGFRRFGQKLSAGLRNFMQGRYGGDKLNMTILWTGVAACILGMFIPHSTIKLALTLVS